MVEAYGKAFGNTWRCMLATAMFALALPAGARDKSPPPPPCPLNATLRVADAASIAGIQSLSQCSNITVAPARPSEVPERPDLRIAPRDTAPRRTEAAMILASADAAEMPSGKAAASGSQLARADAIGPMRTLAIAPAADEPVSLAAALPVADAERILTMRPVSYTTRYDAMIGRVAARHRIDPLLLHAVIDQESHYRANAVSRAGARGLMQLMPGTARTLDLQGAAIDNAEANVDGGARLLRQLHGRFNDFTLTLAAYNAGEGAVRKYGNRVPPYAETQDYVRRVLARYETLVAEQASGAR